MNYIVSTKHTRATDEYITLWRPGNAGYTQFLESAGEYPNPEKGYHDSENAFPVSVRAIKQLSMPSSDRWEDIRVLPNTKRVWLALNRPDIAAKIKQQKTT